MSDQAFESLMAQPARIEPAPEPAAALDAISLIEVDAATLGKVVELTARTGLAPALVVKVALRALEVELASGRKARKR